MQTPDTTQTYASCLDPAMDMAGTARKIVEESGMNLFLTGKAGTGKTTFLKKLTKESRKRIVVLAPTGVAAINAGGNTIHSFFQLDFAPFIPGVSSATSAAGNRFSKAKLAIIRAMDVLVIDEISMVRPDVLDAVDAVLRRFRNPLRPFGGVQLLLIGDLRQLAPVAQEAEWQILKDHYSSPYFFESAALKEAGFLMIELTKVYRQNDERFIALLNQIRDNTATRATLDELNRRAHPSLMPVGDADEGYIRLTTHNFRADRINSLRLASIPSPGVTFKADISGDFPRSAFPADENLTLKTGAQVMFVKNDSSGQHLYYNGLIGHIVALSANEIVVRPRPSSETGIQGADIKVGKVSWDNVRYELQPNGELKEYVEGSFAQVPLRLAWAITIHKSQGLTFDRAIVDAARSFAPGQTYVALSRCRSLEGLVLDSPLPPSAIMTDPAVTRFVASKSSMDSDERQLDQLRRAYHFDLLMDLFSFREIDNLFDSYYRACAASLPKKFPNFMAAADHCRLSVVPRINDVAAKMQTFLAQGRLALTRKNDGKSDNEAESIIEKKVKGGAAFFLELIADLMRVVEITPAGLENKTLAKRLKNFTDQLRLALALKMRLLKYFSRQPFSTDNYLHLKAVEIAQDAASGKQTASSRRKRK